MAMVLVQSRLGGSGSQGSTPAPWTLTSSAVGFSSTTTAGNLLVCACYGRTSSATTGVGNGNLTPTTSGITWTSAGIQNAWSVTPGTTGGSYNIYYSANAPSITSATTTAVAHSTAGSGFSASMSVEFALYEFSGIATTSPVNVTRAPGQSTGTPGAGTLTTTLTDLVIVAFSGNSANATAGSGYTLGVNMTVSTTGQLQYALDVPAGGQATAFTPGAQTNFAAGAVGFKIAPAPASTPRTYGFFFGD